MSFLVINADRAQAIVSGANILEELVEQTRWHIVYRYIFEQNGRYWEVLLGHAATEEQEHEWEQEDSFKCQEVVPIEVTETKWVVK